MLESAKWLSAGKIEGCPEFIGRFETAKKIRKATLEMSACGVYYAELNGKPVGDFVLAPGWTVYAKRIGSELRRDGADGAHEHSDG